MKKFFFLFAIFIYSFTLFAQNPQLLKDVFPGNNTGTISQIVKTSNYTFFNEDDDDADTNRSLYRTDGTPGGTIKLNLTYLPDPPPSANNYLSTKAEKLTALGDKVIFAGDNAAYYGEIWASDGTQAGTVAIERFQPTINNKAPVFELAEMNGYVYYGVTANNNKTQIRRTNGTPGGTSLVYEFSSYLTAPETGLFKVINGILYFNLYDQNGTGYDQLWRCDGTSEGTYLLKDFGIDQYVASWYMPAKSGLFYWMVVKPGTGNVLWKSDGTIAGTESLKTINTTTGNNTYPQFAATIGNNIAFAGLDGNGKELWTTDGTAAGTNMVADINPGAANSNPSGLIFMNNRIYFSATTATSGTELWESDGSASGTVLVKDINPGVANSSPRSLVLSNNTILFRATTVTNGDELWITDGTAANTLIAADINPGVGNASPNLLTPGNPVYFAANNGVSGFEVFKYDNSEGVLGAKKVWLTGAAFGEWKQEGVIKMTNNGGGIFTATNIQIIGTGGESSYFKFTEGTWASAAGRSLTTPAPGFPTGVTELSSVTEPLGVDNVITGTPGYWNVTYNYITKAYSFVPTPADNWGIVGTGTPNGWGGPDMPLTYDALTNKWSAVVSLIDGEIKFRNNNNWSVNFGDNGVDGTLDTNGANIAITAGRYLVTLDFNTWTYKLIKVVLYVNDTNQVGDVFTSTIGNDTNSGTSSAPFATMSHAITVAPAGSYIYVDSGTYTEQVTTDKGITIIGAGHELTSLNKPTETFAPPGLFTEQGVIQTAQNIGDVFIENMSVTGGPNVTPIIIQSGGGVKNCKLQNGNQGVFFRVESTTKTALVENNSISAEYIGVNFAGSGLTASLINNTITVTNPGFSAGIFAGVDFGSLPQLTITGNSISNYATYGLLGGSNNSNITQNSIVGNGQAINTNTTLQATCNWFGAANAATVSSKIIGDANYTPWLTNGTDSDLDSNGFQPIPDICNGTPVTVALDNTTNSTCNGANTGTINITVSNGLAPYSYLWTNSDDPEFSSSSEDLTNLEPGTYQLLLTDTNGSTASLSSIVISEPTELMATISNNSTICSNNATVLASGGTPGYTYLWSNGATTASINNVPVGTYSVTVTDANGCTTTAAISLTVGEAFNPSASVTDVSCFGGSNGAITVTNANGTAPFTFSINGGAFIEEGTLPYSFTDLAAGSYDIAVKDFNGCTGFVTKTITQPAEFSASIISVQNSCFGQSNGSISVATTGGSGALNYSWTGPGGYTSSQKNISSLPVGSYDLTVTDNNGCSAFLTVDVPSFNPITVSQIITNVSCRGTLTGAIDLTVSGGSGNGFAYSWTGNTISTSEDISNLGASSNYKVTITDIGSGCTVSKTYIITQPNSNLAISVSKTNAIGCNLGAITVTGSGGTPGYTYSINGVSYQSSNTFSGLSAGSYTLWVKDANNCTKSSALISITDNGTDAYESNNSKNQAKLIAIGATINARIAVSTDTADWFKFVTPAGSGNYKLNLSHQTVNYTFNMYPAGNNTAALAPSESTQNTKQYSLSGGTTYYVQISGGLSYNCYDLNVSAVSAIGKHNASEDKNTEINKLSATAYPNPHQGMFNLAVESPEDGMAKVELFNSLGQRLASKTVLVQKSETSIVQFNDVSQGIILYQVTIGKHIANGKVIGK